MLRFVLSEHADTNPKGDAMHTFPVTCPCGCGTAVTATDAGFAATTVEVAACPMWAANGIVSSTMRKSWAFANAVPATETMVRHADGLVWLGA